MHGRSEAALHRWDLAGDDEVSQELLRQPELTVHAVEVLNTMLDASPEAVSGTPRRPASPISERTSAAPGQPDVVLIVDGAGARLELDEPRARACADRRSRHPLAGPVGPEVSDTAHHAGTETNPALMR